MKEFKINEFLTLKLEAGKTNIYIKEQPFMQCKCLFLNSHKRRTKNVSQIDIIYENEPFNATNIYWISEETEFWAYCSNLEAWFENNYSTELLHREIAFPLLKKLSDAGDPLAIEVFSDQIIKRLETGSDRVTTYLIKEKYLDYLNEKQLEYLFTSKIFKKALSNLFAFNTYNTQVTYFPLLKKFTDQNINAAVNLLKSQILDKARNYDNLFFFIKNDYLKYLTRDEYSRLGITEDLKEELKIVQEFRGRISYKNKGTFLKEFRGSSHYKDELYTIEKNHVIGLFLTNHYSLKEGVPANILKLKHLEFLNLSWNHLKSIPKEISQLRNLKILILKNNDLTSLPDTIGELHYLEELDISNNDLISIPESVGDLKVLKILNLRSNSLEEFPVSVINLKSLKILRLGSRKGYVSGNINTISEIPDTILGLESLRILGLENNELTELPEEIGKLPFLEKLNLTSNNLEEIPSSIGNLQSLVEFNLSSNKITKLPLSFGNLKSLRNLDLSNNRLKGLPEEIGNLHFLEKLNLDHNNIEEIPSSIGNLQSLVEFNLSSNKITKLPISFGNLKSLKKFRYSDNQIEDIPESIKNLNTTANFSILKSMAKKESKQAWKILKQKLKLIIDPNNFGEVNKLLTEFYFENVNITDIESNLFTKDIIIEEILSLKEFDSHHALSEIFQKLIKHGSKRALAMLKDELIKIISSTDTQPIFYLEPYFMILDEEALLDVYKCINKKHLEQLTNYLLEEAKTDVFKGKKFEGKYFLQSLRSVGFDFIQNLISNLDEGIQKSFILYLFKDWEYEYFEFLGYKELSEKFLLTLKPDLFQLFLNIFIETILLKIKTTNYDLNPDELYLRYVDVALKIMIPKRFNIWNDFYKKKILKKSKQEILSILLYLFIVGCFEDLPTTDILSYFKNFTLEDIGEILVRYLKQPSGTTFYDYHSIQYSKLGPYGLKLLFYLINHIEDWEYRDLFIYNIKDLQKEFPQVINEEIVKYSRDSNMDAEFLLFNLMPLLEEKYRAVVSNDIDISECLKKTNTDPYSFIENIIKKIEEKEIKIDDPLNSKFVESFMEEFIINKQWYEYDDELFKAFITLTSESQIVDILRRYIDRLSVENIKRFLLMDLDYESILKSTEKLPDQFKQLVIRDFENEIRKYNRIMKNDPFYSLSFSKKYIEDIKSSRRILDILTGKITKEFRFNEYLSMRLEDGRIDLYVKGKRFQQCIQLLINISMEKIEMSKNLETIDEIVDVVDTVDNSEDKKTRYKSLTIEEEFWGHCSYLQAWVNHDYDTRLLHRSFAFPLLKRLTELGDPIAKRVYKEEIKRRFLHGNFNVITYLLDEKYFYGLLTMEELHTLFSDFDFNKIIIDDVSKYIPLLKKLIRLEELIPTQVLKKEVKKIFQKGDFREISYTINNGRLYLFSEEELNQLLDHFNFSILIKDEPHRSLPLFRKLADLGNEKAKFMFSREVDSRINSGKVSDISFLINNSYFTPYSQEKRAEIIDRINTNNILNQNYSQSSLSLLKKIAELGSQKVHKILESEIKRLFLSDNFQNPIDIIDDNFLELLAKNEIEILFDQIDLRIFPEEKFERKLYFLKKMIELGITTAKKTIIQEIIDIFSSENLTYHQIEPVFFPKYDSPPIDLVTLFKPEELDEIIGKIDYTNIDFVILLQLSNLRFSEPIKIIRERINKNEKFKDIFISSLRKDSPFSIPFKTILMFAEHSIEEAQQFLVAIMRYIFEIGPLSHIGFLSRPEYLKFLEDEDIKQNFSMSNTALKKFLNNALESEKSILLALTILKRMAEKGDNEAFKFLKQNVIRIINTDLSSIKTFFEYFRTSSMKTFLEKDGFLD